jgi:hypothetical protein
MARPEGVEPTTSGFVVQRSIQLSYGRVGGINIDVMRQVNRELLGARRALYIVFCAFF